MKRAIIIGNGFDLALNAKTSFGDFLKSSFFIGLTRTNTLKQHCLNNLKVNNNWSDIEGGLAVWAAKRNELQGRKYASSMPTNVVPGAQRDYQELADAIDSFLKDAMKHYDPKPNPLLDELFGAWLREEQVVVYNFNYTDLFNVYLNNLRSRAYSTLNVIQRHVHGQLSKSNCVFGTMSRDLPSEFKFMAKTTISDELPPFRYLISDSSELIFFGHSFGRSDWNYLRNIFEDLERPENINVKVFCYTKDQSSCRILRQNLITMSNEMLNRDLIDEWAHEGRELKFEAVEDLTINFSLPFSSKVQ